MTQKTIEIDKDNLSKYYYLVRKKEPYYRKRKKEVAEGDKRIIEKLKLDEVTLFNYLKDEYSEIINTCLDSLPTKSRNPKVLLIGGREGHFINAIINFLTEINENIIYVVCNYKDSLIEDYYELFKKNKNIYPISQGNLLHNDFKKDLNSHHPFDLIFCFDILHSYCEYDAEYISKNIFYNFLDNYGRLIIGWKNQNHEMWQKGIKVMDDTYDVRGFRPVRYMKNAVDIESWLNIGGARFQLQKGIPLTLSKKDYIQGDSSVQDVQVYNSEYFMGIFTK